MKLISINHPVAPRPGALIGDEVLDFSAAAGLYPEARCIPGNVRDILAAGDSGIDSARRLVDRIQNGSAQTLDDLRATGALHDRSDVELAAPIPDPGIIISAGQTYAGHVREMAARRGISAEMPANPRGFLKNPNAVIGPEAAIILPASHPDHVDFEGEFAVVIGRECHGVTPKEAESCVAGFTIVNDVSARDWASGKGTRDQTLLGKQFPTFCPLGPAIVTRDEIPDPHVLHLTTTLNGEIMQSEGTDDLIFTFWEIVSWYARFYRLCPGDVITSGTPGGTGHARNPKVYMSPGDRVEVSVDGVGTLGNPIKAASGSTD